ncbi:MAG: chromosomal replication initiator protein DnaA [Candidatus Omnitrophota bacterium]
MQNLWEKTRSFLKAESDELMFDTWFSPISQVSENENSVTLGVPSKFHESWLKDKYLDILKTALLRAAGKPVEIIFTVTDISGLDAAVFPSSRGASPKQTVPDPQQKDQPVGWLKSVFSAARPSPESRSKDFGLKENYTFNNFVVGPSNRFAHAAALAVCDKLSRAYNPLFIYGGVGLGKTHLMQALAHEILARYPKIKILYITSEDFTNQLISAIRTKSTQKFRSTFRSVDVLIVDDIQFISGKEATQEEFFHTFNSLYDSHKQLVFCSDRSPKEIPGLEERLVGRFSWGLTADIQAPDFETRSAIIEKKCENEKIKIPQEVLYFLAENIKTNIRELEGALIRVVAYSHLTGKEMSAELAKEILKGMISSGNRNISIDLIQRKVSEFFGINEAEMKTKKRSRSVSYPRQIAMFLSREMTNFSLPDIGGFFGGRDHSTVMHACDKINKEIKLNDHTKDIIEKLSQSIKN